MERQAACKKRDLACIAEDLLARWEQADRRFAAAEAAKPVEERDCLRCELEDGKADLEL